LERIINARIRAIVDIRPEQCGFRKGVGTTDAIFAIRQLFEKHRAVRKTVHAAFLDMEKAFDRVPHELIWFALRDHGVPEEYIDWIKLMYECTQSVVLCPAGLSEPYRISVGVHQGSALSPLLFILIMDTISRRLATPVPWSLFYADDVALCDTSRSNLQSRTQDWKDTLQRFGLKLNISKTEYLEFGPQTPGSIKVDGTDLTKTCAFKYLGSCLDCAGDTTVDASARAAAAWLKWREVKGVMCDKHVPNWLKWKIFCSVLRPVALYGSESRSSIKADIQILHVMQMNMLRWSLGLSRLDRIENTEVLRRMGVAPIEDKLAEGRLRWFGHVQRRDDESVARTALSLTVDGKKPVGHPKRTWMDNVAKDMKDAGVTADDALDRAAWRRRTHKADLGFPRD